VDLKVSENKINIFLKV